MNLGVGDEQIGRMDASKSIELKQWIWHSCENEGDQNIYFTVSWKSKREY